MSVLHNHVGRIEDFYTTYNIALDDLDLDTWVGLFNHDCLYRVVPRENYQAGLPLSTIRCSSRAMLADRVKGIRQTMMYAPRSCRRFMSSLRIVRDASESASGLLEVRSSFLCVQTLTDEPSEVAFCGVAYDKFSDDDDKLSLAERVCVLDTEMIPNSLIYPL